MRSATPRAIFVSSSFESGREKRPERIQLACLAFVDVEEGEVAGRAAAPSVESPRAGMSRIGPVREVLTTPWEHHERCR
jgi:hypothetical protein